MKDPKAMSPSRGATHNITRFSNTSIDVALANIASQLNANDGFANAGRLLYVNIQFMLLDGANYEFFLHELIANDTSLY